MTNTLSWASSIRAEGIVRAPHGSAPNAVIDPRDIAEVAVRALTEPGYEGRELPLTGPAALNPAQQTEQLAEAIGRPLRFVELTPGQVGEGLARRYPAVVVEALLSSMERQAAGAKSRVEPTVAEVTGRAPCAFRTWARDHAAAFA
jgi:uncharacterized protein YbjT (DUF2867 family)